MLIVFVYGNEATYLKQWATQFLQRKMCTCIREGFYSHEDLETDHHQTPIDGLILGINQLDDTLALDSFKTSIKNKYFIAHQSDGNAIGFNPRYLVIYDEIYAMKYLYENLKGHINIEYNLANKSFIR